MKNTTRQATKFHGTQEYINKNTGEIIPMEVISIEERDANFEKLWLGNVIQALDMLGSQKVKVLCYLMEKKNKENRIIGTQRKIAEQTGVSLRIVSQTIKALQQADFLQMEQQGVYQINPNCIFKGGKKERFNVLYQYHSIQNLEETEEK